MTFTQSDAGACLLVEEAREIEARKLYSLQVQRL